MIKKIISWILFIFFTASMMTSMMSPQIFRVPFEMFGDYVYVFFLFGTIIILTLLIHYYSSGEKLIKMIKKTWVYQMIFTVLFIICYIFFGLDSFLIITLLFILTVAAFLSSVMLLLVSSKKIHNVIILLILLSVAGILFKIFHLTGAGVLLTTCLLLPGILYLFLFYSKITEYENRTNKFLNFFKNLICLTLMISFMGLNFKLMHWPGGDFLKTLSMPAFLLSMLSLIFLLPVSNFIEWTRHHKQIFYRAILIPLIFQTIITTWANVYPVTFRNIFFSGKVENAIGFYMYDYEITENTVNGTQNN